MADGYFTSEKVRSGCKGILDESECPQTFGRLLEMVQDIITGAEIAVADKVEGSGNDLNAG